MTGMCAMTGMGRVARLAGDDGVVFLPGAIRRGGGGDRGASHVGRLVAGLRDGGVGIGRRGLGDAGRRGESRQQAGDNAPMGARR